MKGDEGERRKRRGGEETERIPKGVRRDLMKTP